MQSQRVIGRRDKKRNIEREEKKKINIYVSNVERVCWEDLQVYTGVQKAHGL